MRQQCVKASNSVVLYTLSDQYDFVRGVRQYSAAHMPLVNRIGNRVFDTLLKLMHGLEGRDHLSGLYGLRREALQAMDLTADGFELEVEIGIKAHARQLTGPPVLRDGVGRSGRRWQGAKQAAAGKARQTIQDQQEPVARFRIVTHWP
jgi:dolichol-phosphate mannosyltransferase